MWYTSLIVAVLTAIWLTLFSVNRIHKETQLQICVENLTAIAWGKKRWKAKNCVPPVSSKCTGVTALANTDIFGATAWINPTPVCPKGGTYTLNTVNAVPTCSIAGHHI